MTDIEGNQDTTRERKSRVGATIGRYKTELLVGGGGMGEVYSARDPELGRQVALKVLRNEMLCDRQALVRFLAEARAASALNHPNIVTIYDAGESEGDRFIAMELVDGCTLRAVIERRVPPETAADLVRQTAQALAVAHAAGIVHRDVKPENVMLRKDGWVKILDFGLARLRVDELPDLSEPDTGQTMPGAFIGTLNYMSPEQLQGEPATPASDAFSLGIILYELLTGLHPFRRESRIGLMNAVLSQPPLPPSRVNPEVPEALERIALAMLEKLPESRPQLADVASALGALTSMSAAAPRAPAIPPVRRHTVGHARERAELEAAFATAAAGNALLLCVTGEPGIGKTTLVEEFLDGLGAPGRPCAIARGRSSERLAGTEAYLPLLEALESLLRGEQSETAARLMRLFAPTWYVQVVPLASSDYSAERLREAQAASQDRLKRELLKFIEELTRFTPLVVFIDDMHWADASTTDVIAYLASRLARLPLLLLVTYRPSDLLLAKHPFQQVRQELFGRGASREIAVEFLSREDVERYLTLVFPNHRLPAGLAALLQTRTEGNPLFVADLLRDLADRQAIVERDGTFELAVTLASLERDIPASVRSMVERKVERLTEDDRKLLVAAAVQGYEFDAAVLATALDLDAADVEERLEALERAYALARLVEERELPDRTLTLSYQFVHVLYQDALYATLKPARRASLSASVARALELHHRDQTEALAATLALLYAAARDFGPASRYFLAAAEQAERVFAHGEAVRLARGGLDAIKALPDGPERDERELGLQMALGAALQATQGMASSEVERAHSRAQALAEQAVDSPQVFNVLRSLWSFHVVRADVERGRALAEELLRMADAKGDADLQLIGHHALGFSLSTLGEDVQAIEHLERGLALHDPKRFRRDTFAFAIDSGVACACQVALPLWRTGNPDRALRRSVEATALAEKVAGPYNIGFARVFAGMLHQLRREVEATRREAEAALAVGAEHGLMEILAWGSISLGWAMAMQGDAEAGVAHLRGAIGGSAAIGSRIARGQHLVLLAEALERAGRPDEGLTALDDALAAVAQSGECYCEPEIHRLRGQLLMAQAGADAAPRAEAAFRQAIDVARRLGAPSYELTAGTSLARLLHEQRRQDEARSLLSPILGAFSEGFETTPLIQAKEVLATLG